MLETKKGAHPTENQIYEYCHSRLDEVASGILARHLDHCPACLQRVEQGRAFLGLLGGLTAFNYGAAYHRDLLRQALATAARRHARPACRRRLRQWAEREEEFAGLVVQWTPGETNHAAQLKSVRTFTGSSSWHLQAGSTPGKPLNSTEPHASAWPAMADQIGVLVRHWPLRQAAPLVLFTPETEPARVQVDIPRPHPKWRARLASFRANYPGRFLLGFEPPAGLRDES